MPFTAGMQHLLSRCSTSLAEVLGIAQEGKVVGKGKVKDAYDMPEGASVQIGEGVMLPHQNCRP